MKISVKKNENIVFNSFLIAFATYSRIPVPQAEWNEKNMKYSICFFPLVGAVVGLILYLWGIFSQYMDFNNIFFAAISACIPTFITGGIHMDGYCDTIDALSSYQPMERKLEILKDSNAGAFAVIKNSVYFIIYFAAFTQISQTGVLALSIAFILSRSLSGIGVINFRSAKGSGLASAFKSASSSNKKTITAILIAVSILSLLAISLISVIISVFIGISAIFIFIYYKYIAYSQFGGITGDIAGFFLVMCELFMALSIILSEGILKLWS